MLVDTKSILRRARSGAYAVGAFNVYNLEGASAVVQTAAEMKSPVILQILPSALKIAGRPLVELCLAMARDAEVPVAVHLDHCPSKEQILHALDCGISSVMADGSELSYQDNIEFSRNIVTETRARNTHGTVEAELGKLSGEEDGEFVSAREAKMTSPDQAVEFVKETGVDALAVCIGNIHGKYHSPPQLDFDRLAAIAKGVSIPLVLHGTSGLPDEMITQAIDLGVSKFNVNTEVRSIYLETMANIFLNSSNVELIHLMEESIKAMKRPIRNKIQLFCSAGRA